MSTPLTLIVTLHARPEHREAVRGLLLQLATQTTREEGNICYIVHEVADAPNEFVIYEQWKDQAALDFHMEQPYLVAFLAREEELLSRKIDGKFCTAISAPTDCGS